MSCARLIAVQHDKIKFYVSKLEQNQSSGYNGPRNNVMAVSKLLQRPEYREAATKLQAAKLTLDGLKDALPDTLLINNLLETAGIASPGDRLTIINAIKKG